MTEGIKIEINGFEGLDALFKMARYGNEGFNSAFPLTKRELFDCALMIESAWKDWASMNHEIPGVKNIPRASPEIMDSIKRNPKKAGAFEYTIASNHPLMADYQNGVDYTVDMKAPNSPWLNGKKSRLNKKDGSPYLIVPFSWGTGEAHFKNIVPAGIQRMLRSRVLSERLPTTHTEPNARGEDILRHEYNWGGRVSEDEAAHADDNGNLTGYDAGMVRMKDERHPSGNGGKYFTFRVISAKAAAYKWIQHRHIAPIDVVGGLKREFEQVIVGRVKEAWAADSERLMNG